MIDEGQPQLVTFCISSPPSYLSLSYDPSIKERRRSKVVIRSRLRKDLCGEGEDDIFKNKVSTSGVTRVFGR